MTVDTFIGPQTPYPIGAIVLWTRPLKQVPEGWVVCDGNNGTPDLRNRFIRGVNSASTDPGATGGTNWLNLSVSQLPSHSHSASTGSTAGSHTHTVTSDDNVGQGYDENAEGCTPETSRPTTNNGSHSHRVDFYTSGGGSSIDNQPSYHELVFIQRHE